MSGVSTELERVSVLHVESIDAALGWDYLLFPDLAKDVKGTTGKAKKKNHKRSCP